LVNKLLGESALDQLYSQDQAERNEYRNHYLSKYPDWKQAAAAFAKKYGRKTDDIFDDAERAARAKQLIQTNINEIKGNSSELNKAWLLVQHMDKDAEFQQWFLQHLKQGTEEHKYLHDRVAVNSGRKQQYGTQVESTRIRIDTLFETLTGYGSGGGVTGSTGGGNETDPGSSIWQMQHPVKPLHPQQRCDNCGSTEDLYVGPDPYYEEMSPGQEHNDVCLCPKCYTRSVQDI
jgi:hypothetical protein